MKEIESALSNLTLDEKQAVRDWLDDLIEEQLEVSDEFKATESNPASTGKSLAGGLPSLPHNAPVIAANLLPHLALTFCCTSRCWRIRSGGCVAMAPHFAKPLWKARLELAGASRAVSIGV